MPFITTFGGVALVPRSPSYVAQLGQVSGTGGITNFGPFDELIASLPIVCPAYGGFVIGVRSSSLVASNIQVQIGVGAAGSERVIAQTRWLMEPSQAQSIFLPLVEFVDAGTRFSMRSATNDASAASIICTANLGQL